MRRGIENLAPLHDCIQYHTWVVPLTEASSSSLCGSIIRAYCEFHGVSCHGHHNMRVGPTLCRRTIKTILYVTFTIDSTGSVIVYTNHGITYVIVLLVATEPKYFPPTACLAVCASSKQNPCEVRKTKHARAQRMFRATVPCHFSVCEHKLLP